MKLLICGKGGSGKSTVSVLMARAFQRLGKRVLLVDADESNLGLHRLAGSPSAETLLEAMGGKAGLRSRKQAMPFRPRPVRPSTKPLLPGKTFRSAASRTRMASACSKSGRSRPSAKAVPAPWAGSCDRFC
jgi:CO dehydrogenase nickel-insertion accessory protein CooC1